MDVIGRSLDCKELPIVSRAANTILGAAVDIEARLRKLESRYRVASSEALAAKAHYLALRSEPLTTGAALERAKALWDGLESRKREIANRIGEIEESDQDMPAP